MKLSVITPSRLAINPTSVYANLWLDRSLGSAMRQTADVELEVVVGLDPGATLPERFMNHGIKWVVSETASQAAAVNAAAAAATGDVLAFLEDDDVWDPIKLAVQLPLLDRYAMVTSNQREIDEHGNYLRTNDFPTPSGWVMRRETWEKVGGFDESFRFHVDTEWLGRAKVCDVSRAHVVEEGASKSPNRPWLENVAAHSDIHESQEFNPLVSRLVNRAGGMWQIATRPEAGAVSVDEHRRIHEKFGRVPW